MSLDTTPPPSRGPGRDRPHPLHPVFAPKTVAVIGATDRAGSVGRSIVRNLNNPSFSGTIFPVNPKRPTVLGLKAFPSLAAVPEPVDLAVVVTPAATVPDVIRESVDAGVKAAIVISAGFKESGAEGAELERQVFEIARRGKLRIIGPNCLGVMTPPSGFNATFATTLARPGNVGFISQSGALCTAVLDWSLRENVGFSAFVSIGSMVDVGWGDLIDYLGDDPRTQSILIYMESVGDARSFLSAAREVALSKPIIVLKAGRTQAAAKAAASHTGALTGSDEVLDAAFRRCGVLRVNEIAELFNMAEVLGRQPRPRGPRLAMVSNAGGPAVLATDALIASGGETAPLADATIQALNELLPPHWSHNNPVDILGDADAERYAKAVKIVAEDPTSDGLLVILAPQAMTDAAQIAEQVKQHAHAHDKPILASWMGGAEVAAGEMILNRADIPTFPFPDTAARLFTHMWRYSDNLDGLYETPMLPAGLDEGRLNRERAAEVIRGAQSAGRTLLTELESKQILAAYNIPAVETRAATNEAEAVAAAAAIGYPAVLKLLSETITHKTDVGGVQLNLTDEAMIRRAYRAIETSVFDKAGPGNFSGVTVQPMITLDGYELIVGSSLDPQFGPVLLFGSGGQLVEVYKDRALGLPPLNTTLARRMMEQTRIFSALKGVRGRRSVDLPALEQLLVRFSYLVADHRGIKEIDINPLVASSDRLLALDARVVLHGPEVPEEARPKLVIRPYPMQYVEPWTLRDGTPVTIRPIRPEDEPLMAKFHEGLSARSVYLRYFYMVSLSQRIAHKRLTRMCFIDYDRAMALVADHKDLQTGEHQILGVGRLIKMHGTNTAEFAIIVADQYQRRGLGTELLRRLLQIGRDEKLDRISGDILYENRDMQHLCDKMGIKLRYSREEGVVKAAMDL